MSLRLRLSAYLRATAVVLLCLSVVSCSKTARRARVTKRAETYFRAGQLDQAKVEYSNLLRLDPTNPLSFQRLGSIWFQEGAPLRSAPFLLKARELAPNDLGTRLNLAHVYLAVGHRTEAFAEAMNVLQHQTDNAEAAQVAAEAAQTDPERSQVAQAIAKMPDQNAVSVQLAVGTLAMANGNPVAAKKAVESAIAADVKSAPAHVFMGTLWMGERQLVNAGNEFKLAAALSPPRSAERLRYAQFEVQSGATDDALATLRSITSTAPDFLPAWLLQAEISLAKKNYPEATRLLANVLNRDPENIDGNVLQARTWIASGNFDKAVQTLQRLDDQYPDFPPLKLELARAYVQKNNLSQAATVLEQALKVSPDFVDAALLLGQINLRTDKPKAVVEAMKSLTSKHSNVSAAKLLLADGYRALGQLDDAADIFRERLSILPNDVEACIALGVILRQQKKDDEAREMLERAQRLAPGNTLPLVQLVDLDLTAGKFDSAERRVQEQISGAINPAVVSYLQGKVYAAEKKWDLAESALTKAINLNPDTSNAYELLATVYLASNKLADAARQLEAVVKRTPNDTRTLMTLGGLYEKLHDYEKARDVYEKALAVAPDFAPALNNLAFVYTEHFNQLDRAYQLAEKARGLQPGEASIADTLAWVYYKKQEYQQAIGLLNEAVTKAPNDPEIRYHLGMCQYMIGSADSARASFEQSLKSPTDFPSKQDAQRRLVLLSRSQNDQALNAGELQAIVNQQPDDVFARTRLAASYEAAGSFKDAVAQYDQILKLNPKSASAMAKLAEIYAGPLNDPPRALEFARSARDLSPADPQIDLLVGRIAYKTRNYSWAYSLLKQAAGELPRSPEAMHALGWAAFSVGKIPEARDCMERVTRMAAGSSIAEDAKTWLTFDKFATESGAANQRVAEIEAALKRDPGYVPALLAQAAIAANGSDSIRAINLYQQVLSRFPEFAPAQKHLAALYAQRPGELNKAYDMATKARKALPDDVGLTRTLAEISYQRRDYQRALELLEEAGQKEPLQANDLYYMGMCFLQTKDLDHARASLNQALAGGLRDPFATEAAKTLQQIKQ